MASKPTTYLNWTDGSATKVTQPPSSQLLSGWTAGQPIPFQYLNYNFYLLDQWVQYLDGIVNSDVVTENASQLMRLINGGNWSYVASTGTITWSAAFNLAVPGIADADNQAAAGSISLSDGQIAYVTANIPFNSTGTTASGSNQVTGLTYTTGIVVGQTVTGTGIPSSTTVTAISGTTITISNNATANGTVPLTFSSTGSLTVSSATNSSFVPSPTTIIIARRVGSVVYLGVNATQMLLRDQESKLISDLGYLNVLTLTAGQNLTANQAVYISPGTGIDAARTAGAVYPTDASSANGSIRSQFIGFVLTAATTGNSVSVVSGGVLPGFTLTAGSIYYLNPSTVGAITSTRPTTANLYLCPVGTAISSTTLDIAPVATAVITAAAGVGLAASGVLAINPATQSPYNVTTGNNGQVLLVNTANGACTFNLPTPVTNLIFTIKDVAGQANSNPMTFHRAASELIENIASDYVAYANYGEWTLTSDGTNWFFVTK